MLARKVFKTSSRYILDISFRHIDTKFIIILEFDVVHLRTSKRILFNLSVSLFTVREKTDTDSLSREPEDELLDQIACYIGREYFFVGLELGVSCCEIEQLKMDETGLKLIRKLLMHWKTNTDPRKTTVKALASALQESGSGGFQSLLELLKPTFHE